MPIIGARQAERQEAPPPLRHERHPPPRRLQSRAEAAAWAAERLAALEQLRPAYEQFQLLEEVA